MSDSTAQSPENVPSGPPRTGPAIEIRDLHKTFVIQHQFWDMKITETEK